MVFINFVIVKTAKKDRFPQKVKKKPLVEKRRILFGELA